MSADWGGADGTWVGLQHGGGCGGVIGPRCGFAAGRHPPSPRPSREEKAELLLDSQAEVQGLEAEIRRLRQEVRSNIPVHCPLPIVVPLLPAAPSPLSVPWLADPSSTPSGPDPGTVRTS